MIGNWTCGRCGMPIYWHDILRGWFHRKPADTAACGRDTYPALTNG